MIKLIATDLDGTLFYPRRKFTLMTRANARFLKQYIEKENKVIVVSSRNWNIIKQIEKKIGKPISMVGCNGAVIYHDGKIVAATPMNGSVITEIYMKMRRDFGVIGWVMVDYHEDVTLTFLRGSSSMFLLCCAWFYNLIGGKYREKFNLSEKEMLKRINNPKGGAYKLMAVFGITKHSSQRAHEAYLSIMEMFSHQMEISWVNNAIEFTALGVNKASALKYLLNLEGIKEEETAVVGDSGNDQILFENFENSFVMSHASKIIKKFAAHEIERVSDIEKFL